MPEPADWIKGIKGIKEVKEIVRCCTIPARNASEWILLDPQVAIHSLAHRAGISSLRDAEGQEASVKGIKEVKEVVRCCPIPARSTSEWILFDPQGAIHSRALRAGTSSLRDAGGQEASVKGIKEVKEAVRCCLIPARSASKWILFDPQGAIHSRALRAGISSLRDAGRQQANPPPAWNSKPLRANPDDALQPTWKWPRPVQTAQWAFPGASGNRLRVFGGFDGLF